MSRFSVLTFILSFLLSSPTFVFANNACITHDCAKCHSLKQNEAAEMLKSLGLSVKSVKHAPVSGMFEVLAERNGADGIVFIDYGKRYLMQGVIVDTKKLDTIATHPRAVNPDTDNLKRTPPVVK